jgi:hypothetical protein
VARGWRAFVAMSMEEFIKQNRDRIYNIDGNLDDGDISVMGDDMVLTFYYFKNGELVRSKRNTP